MNCVKVALAFALAGVVVPVQSSAAVFPVLIHLQAALDVDRDGRVGAVTYVDNDKKMPGVIRQRAEQVALGWKFAPPVKDGRPVAGRTYARMSVCIAPQGDGMQYSVLYSNNGPATFFDAPPRRSRSLAFPLSRLLDRGINQYKGKITYVVSADGKAQLESATLDDPQLQKQYGSVWRRDQRWFVEDRRYLPELIDGVPTDTRIETTIEYKWFGSKDAKGIAAEQRDLDAESQACQTLKNSGNRQIASDSAFKRIEG